DLQRLLVLAGMGLLDEQRVADADAEEGASGVVHLDGGELLAHLGSGVHPEGQDAGGGDDRGRGFEERTEWAEHVTTDVRGPQRGVAERLELRRRVADLGRVAVAQLAAPDADAGELHAPFVTAPESGMQPAVRAAARYSAAP